ncbi:MAG: DUF1385 domain-containing protein [Chloroflexi bacterium]|nr:DUF1385 domain-containing protein [Chloroflexota bacterium]
MSSERLPSYGGQALIEGVMMRGSRYVAAAMRSPDGEIVVDTKELPAIYKSNLRKIPFLRGLIMLWDAMGLGIEFLTRSANVQSDEEEKIEGPAFYLTLAVSLLGGALVFFVGPAALGHFFESLTAANGWWGNLIEGAIRLVLIVGYIWAIGKMPDIKRVFAYHGAEHKTINAFEDGAVLTPENVSRYSLEHPRCGTAFLLTLVIFSIILFSLLGPLPIGWRLVSRIVLLPLLAGVAYEYLRWTANNIENPLVCILIKPNLALQHLTTREPDLSMLEVSISAFQAMLAKETQQEDAVPVDQTASTPVTVLSD